MLFKMVNNIILDIFNRINSGIFKNLGKICVNNSFIWRNKAFIMRRIERIQIWILRITFVSNTIINTSKELSIHSRENYLLLNTVEEKELEKMIPVGNEFIRTLNSILN